MNLATKEQIESMKKSIDDMSRSEEQFIFILFKNLDGTDHIIQYGYNMPSEKLSLFFSKMLLNDAEIRED